MKLSTITDNVVGFVSFLAFALQYTLTRTHCCTCGEKIINGQAKHRVTIPMGPDTICWRSNHPVCTSCIRRVPPEAIVVKTSGFGSGILNNIVTKTKIGVVRSLTQPGRTLDIGCSDRTYTEHMPNPVVGIDINKTFEGRIADPDYWMDARELEFANESFDNVCLLDTLEHIKEADVVVKQAWRVLKPDGVIVIVDPDDTTLFWTRLLCGRFAHAFRGNPGHVHKFNKKKLQEKLGQLFELEKVIPRGIFTGYRFRKSRQDTYTKYWAEKVKKEYREIHL